MKKNLRIKSYDQYLLNANIYEAQDAKNNMIIVHGLSEHQGRYEEMAEYFNKQGYNVLTYDLRGHGHEERYDNLGFFSHEDGVVALISDLKLLVDNFKELYPDLPLIMYAHGFGSIIAAVYLRKYDMNIDKLIVSSFPSPDKRAYWMIAVAKFYNKVFGLKGRSRFITRRVFKRYSKDWISYNEDNIKNYQDDDYCGFKITNSAYVDVFKMINDLNNNYNFPAKKPSLDILALTGEDDELIKKAGVSKFFKCLGYSGYRNINHISYKNMKHELIHEDERYKVFEDMIKFIG